MQARTWGNGSPDTEGLVLGYEGEATWSWRRSREVGRDGVGPGDTEPHGGREKNAPILSLCLPLLGAIFPLLAEALVSVLPSLR